MLTDLEKEAKEILDWELSLDSRDLRAWAWYHGPLSRQKAEALLENNGDFLVRDCSSSGRAGDFVLSCRWEDNNLHFLVHKDVVQKDTIYEQLRYRFENENFDTVPDLITYYVGSGIAISMGSGALISNPKNRTTPLLNVAQRSLVLNDVRGGSDYVSLLRSGSLSPDLRSVGSSVEKVSTLERIKQKCLNLNPPEGLLQELEHVPTSLAIKMSQLQVTNDGATGSGSGSGPGSRGKIGQCHSSNFDLSSFTSILFPTNIDNVKLDKGLLETVTTRILEASDRAVALYLTKLDWEILTKTTDANFSKKNSNGDSDQTKNDSENKKDSEGDEKVDQEKEEPDQNQNQNQTQDQDPDPDPEEEVDKAGDAYELFFHSSQHRWNNVIERSLSLSHFIVVTIVMSDQPEMMVNKWIGVAGELKSALGNFFSFSSIMRGLLMPQITRSDGKVNWMKLRQDFTTATFNFETTLRAAYQGLIRGTESYPPNTTIPELLSAALIFEDAIEMMQLSCIRAEEDQLELFCNHLRELKLMASWADIQKRNLERMMTETNIDLNDIVLMDIFRTEFHLLLLWGMDDYPTKSLKERSEHMNSIF